MSSGSLVVATPASWRSLELCWPTKENTHVWPLTRQERSHVWPLCISTVSKTLLQAQHLKSHQAEAPGKIKPSSVCWFAFWFSLVAH